MEKTKSETNKTTESNTNFNNTAHDTPSTNRQIKDGVFKLLFEKPENAAELYYALTGIECSPDEIQIITITTIISGSLKNDLAFVVRGKALVVGEHQSTPNKNMPIRMLMYLGQLYEKWFSVKDERKLLYSTNIHKIPRPEFAVFYNGTHKRPDKEILSLSSAFEDKEAGHSNNVDLGSLELKIPVYNINKGMNKELLSKGEKLRQYSEFVAKLREYQETYDNFERAVKETVAHCIENDILSEFLKEMGGQIMSILTMEYDVEMAKKVYGEELLEKERIDIAKEMLREGDSIDKIARVTKLSLEIIKELQHQI